MRKIYNIRFWTFGGWFTWVAVAIGGSALIGAGVSAYGANKQSQANSAANAANLAAQDRQNNSAWTSWLMSKGIQPTTAVNAGTVPTAGNYSAVNTKMPLWASMNVAAPGAKSRWQKVGSGYKAAGTLAVTPPAATPTASATDGGASSSAGKSVSTGQKIANIIDPANIYMGNNRNNFFDPLGIFG